MKIKINHSSKIQSLVLTAVLSIGSGFVFPASAQENPYILDIHSKEVIDLGNVGWKPGCRL